MFGELKTKQMKDPQLPEIPKDAIKACIECFEPNEATERISSYIETLIEHDRTQLKLMMRIEEIDKIIAKSKAKKQ